MTDPQRRFTLHNTNQFYFVLYGCETWSLTLREDLRVVRVFENRVLRRILGLTGQEIKRNWRKFHTEKLQNLYYTN
jgi:hypothetical protein